MVRGVAEVDLPALAGVRSVRIVDKAVYMLLSHPDHTRRVQEI